MSDKLRKREKRLNIERARAKKARAHTQLRQPTFGDGMASLMDWGGKLAPSLREIYGNASSPEEVDANAIATDWKFVGQDLYGVLNDRERRKALTASSGSD